MEFVLVSILDSFSRILYLNELIVRIVCRTTYFMPILVNIECKFWTSKWGCFQNVFGGLRSLGMTWLNFFSAIDPAVCVCKIIPFVALNQVIWVKEVLKIK